MEDKLRERVVLTVVVGITLLAFGLYGLIGWLIAHDSGVPGELWLAAGNASGALVTLLVNTKSTAAQATTLVQQMPPASGGVTINQAAPAEPDAQDGVVYDDGAPDLDGT